VFLWISHHFWSSAQPSVREGRDERQLSATVILGQITGTITAATVVLAGIGVVATLGATQLPPPARTHLLWAALWILLSLIVAVWALGLLPSRVPNENLARSRETAMVVLTSLYLFVVSACRLGLALWHVLR